ncbi:hypothetical protein NQ315_001934 [Exocentrus adspersus]|uniref:Multidrug resistance-associated protein lethal(2)03659 n=1 Tax=Exocentrus adspersus TaxID=1586481 RepID=A0AAV8WAV4_9CUCU|nr:hypothetical protein NQ315_001934 [Exocentrus adspersus]
MDHSEKVKRKTNPREKANILSLLTFLYTGKLFSKGLRKDLEEDDVYEVIKSCKSKKCGDKLEQEYKKEKQKGKPSLFRLLWTCYGTKYILLGVVHLSWKLVNSVLEPEAIGKLVAYFHPRQTVLTLHDAIYYASIMIGLKLTHCFYFQNYVIYLQQLAIQIRTAFCSLIYRKSLKLSPEAVSEISLGNIITIVTKDVLQFEQSIWLFNDLWIAIVQTIVICYLIYAKIGLSSIVGVGMTLALVPLQVYVGKFIKSMRLSINKKTDQRLQVTQESLSAIRIIKMYTWEQVFGEKIDEKRKDEIKTMMKTSFLKFVMIITSILCSKVGFYALIMIHIWLHNEVSAEVIFYLMRSFGILRHTISFSLAMGMTRIAELSASMSRINKVLKADELEDAIEKPTDFPRVDMKSVSTTIKDKAILKNISLNMETGLTVVTGQLGSGKSSLIKVILKDYPISDGTLTTVGRKSYASQDPWLFPSSIKQNILFGEAFDKERYDTVVRVCALEYDFSLLEKGDETILADRGQNLSRGQQSRVNLARAVYKDSDVYLIDDALTALDGRVQEHIFNECIRGFLKNKLVVLVTHNTKHITNADQVIVLDQGVVKFQGNDKDISGELLAAIEEEAIEEKDVDEVQTDDNVDEKSKLLNDPSLVKRRRIYHEIKQEGGVKWSVYWKYFKFGGGFIMFGLIVSLYFGAQFTDSYSSKLLTNWVNMQQNITNFKELDYTDEIENFANDSEHNFNKTFFNLKTNQTLSLDDINKTVLSMKKLEIQSHKAINLYTLMIVSSTVLELIKYYLVFNFAKNASINLHRRMIKSILHSVMSFFDNYFIGNILNRFIQDLSVIDEHLPFVLSSLAWTMFSVGGVVILIAVVNWRFFIPSLVFLAYLVMLRMFYIPTARSLKRLESATRSPIVGHLNSSMEGLTTIRAYKAQHILSDEFDRHQDLYTSTHYISFCTKRAFAFYMDLSSVIFLTIIVVRFLFFDRGTAAGDVGLAITQAAGLAMAVQWGLMQWAETESLMTSVERVLEYTKLKQETTSGIKIQDWPRKGEINYVNVSLTYRSTNEKVLKNISFTIKPKEKIGIVGRTGAGKSSIIATLFRLYNYEGQIFIDDVEIKTLSLEFLRQHISIIPQDPIMFQGTIRNNIDPLQQYTDEEIWKTIHKVQLESIIPSLDFVISDSNSIFSTGQRQLICLARAIIRKNKIVVLDEATANMDPETEFLIQKAIVENFSQCTVFIIAHRLQSILDCHKVIVMEKGEIVEYEDPLTLMEDGSSLFSRMLKNAGLNQHQ